MMLCGWVDAACVVNVLCAFGVIVGLCCFVLAVLLGDWAYMGILCFRFFDLIVVMCLRCICW